VTDRWVERQLEVRRTLDEAVARGEEEAILATLRRSGNWTDARCLSPAAEVDFHWSDREPDGGSYDDHMAEVRRFAFERIQQAHRLGLAYVILRHGSSTSRPGRKTARSEIRSLLRSKESTPFIFKRKTIDFGSATLVAIRRTSVSAEPRLRCPDCESERVDRVIPTAGLFRCKERSCRRDFQWWNLVVGSEVSDMKSDCESLESRVEELESPR